MESLLEYLRRRATSTLLVSYTVFWCIYHWQGIYTTLFVGQDHILSKYDMLKNEYVNEYFFGVNWTQLWSVSNLCIILGWIIPAILAYLYVWWLPKWAINPGYKQEVRYRTDRKINKIKEEKRISTEEAAAAEKKIKSVDAEIDLAKKRAEAARQDPSIGWAVEYKKFIGNPSAQEALNDLLYCVYEQGGYMHRSTNGYTFPAEAKMYADTWGLATMEQNSITLTNKGRYFAQRYKTNLIENGDE